MFYGNAEEILTSMDDVIIMDYLQSEQYLSEVLLQ